MSQASVLKKVQLGVVALFSFALSACLEVKSDAKVDADTKVHFTTTYDVSKVIAALKASNPNNIEDVAKSLSCEKMNEKLTKEFTCKDLGVGQFSVSAEFQGDALNGVTLDKDKNQISVDAVKLFKKLADLNPEKKDSAESADVASAMLEKSMVPVPLDQAAQYKQMGIGLVLNLTLPHEVLTIDGVPAKDVKDNLVSVNFVDVAGKESYVITAQAGKGGWWWKVVLAGLILLALIAAVLYLLKNKKRHGSALTAPAAVTPQQAELSAHTAPVDEKIDNNGSTPQV